MSAILNLFTGLWAKVSAVLAVIVSVFFLVIRYQSKKIETLKHENKIVTKNVEIAESQAVFKAEILADEQEDILRLVKRNAKKISLDDLNNL